MSRTLNIFGRSIIVPKETTLFFSTVGTALSRSFLRSREIASCRVGFKLRFFLGCVTTKNGSNFNPATWEHPVGGRNAGLCHEYFCLFTPNKTGASKILKKQASGEF